MRPLAIMAFLLSLGSSFAQSETDHEPSFDKALNEATYKSITVSGDNLIVAWQSLSSNYFLRSILVLGTESAKGQIHKTLTDCTAEDVYRTLVSGFPGYTYSTDPKTNIVWIHPSSLKLNEIATESVSIDAPRLGCPLLTGLLKPLEESGLIETQSDLFKDLQAPTFNVPVDLPAGTQDLRSVLSYALLGHPHFGMLLRKKESGAWFVNIANLGAKPNTSLRPGEEVLARIALNGEGFDENKIVAILADHSRVGDYQYEAAFQYVTARAWNFDSEVQVKKLDNPTSASALALSLSELFSRTPKSGTPPVLTNAIQNAATSTSNDMPAFLREWAIIESARISTDSQIIPKAELDSTKFDKRKNKVLARRLAWALSDTGTRVYDEQENAFTRLGAVRKKLYESVTTGAATRFLTEMGTTSTKLNRIAASQ